MMMMMLVAVVVVEVKRWDFRGGSAAFRVALCCMQIL